MRNTGFIAALVALYMGVAGASAIAQTEAPVQTEVPAQGQTPDETPIVVPHRPTSLVRKPGKIAFLGVPWGASRTTVRRTLAKRFAVDRSRTGPLGFKGRFAGLTISGTARFTPLSGRLYAVDVGFGSREVERFLGEKYGMPSTTAGPAWLWRFSNGDLSWDLSRKVLVYGDSSLTSRATREEEVSTKGRLRDL